MGEIMHRSKSRVHDSAIAQSATTSTTSVEIPPGAMTVLVEVPTIDSASVGLTVSHDNSTFYDLTNVDDSVQGRVTAGTGQEMVPFILYGAPSHCKVKLGASQTSGAVTCKVSFSS